MSSEEILKQWLKHIQSVQQILKEHAYLEQMEQIHRNVIPVQAAAADSAYDFPLAHRVLEEQGITFFVRP